MQADTVEIDGGCERPTASKVRVRLLTLDELDGRTSAARLVRELITSIENDLGGSDALTEGQRQLVQRAAVLGAMIEDSETRWIGGAEFDAASYLAQINVQRRVLATIGLERRSRDVTPSLQDYLRDHAARADAAAHAHRVSVAPAGDASSTANDRTSELPFELRSGEAPR